MVGREVVEQLSEGIVEVLLEEHPRPADASLKGCGAVVNQAPLHLAQELQLRGGVVTC